MNSYKDNSNLEHDRGKIQSHLNTSLEQDGISVSEDLIYRTLEAIKNNAALKVEENNTYDKDKVIPYSRYIKGMAGVAVAALIILVGSQGFFRGNLGSKSSRDNATRMSELDAKKEEYSTNSLVETPEAESSLYKADKNIKQDSFSATTEKANARDTAISAPKMSEEENSNELAGIMSEQVNPLLLQEVTVFLPQEVKQILIRKGGKEISLKTLEEIERFYTQMSNVLFTPIDVVPQNVEYTIEIYGEEELEYHNIILIGEGITIRYEYQTEGNDQYYQASDLEEVKRVLESFLSE